MTAGREFLGRVTNGKLPGRIFDDLAEVARRFDGKTLVVSIREQKRRRSTNQNAYYWGVVVLRVTAMFREAGNYVDDNDVHEFLKANVGKLKQNFVTPDGEVLSGPASTAKLTTTEFEVYLEKVRAWAAQWGCEIPLPHETISTTEE